MGTAICPICGTENPVEATHCTNCRVNLRLALKDPDEIERIRREVGQHRESTREESPPVRAAYSPLGERPGCVTLYAVLLGIVAGLTVIEGTISFFALIGGSYENPGLGIIVVAGILVVAGLEFLLARGLWQLKNWARITVIVIQGLGVLSSVLYFVLIALGTRAINLATREITYDTSGIIGEIVGLAISGYIIYWFASHRQHFRG
jgi:ribosomal protein L40E